jgi:hypothetical protein
MLLPESNPSMDVEVIYKNLHKTIKLIPESFIHHPSKGANGIFRPNGITSHSKSPLLVISVVFFYLLEPL